MVSMIDLSIIILNYKSKGLLKQCLKGINLLKLPFSYEIIVVDNNSQDSSVKMMGDYFPGIKIIASPENHGCAAGNNLGLKEAQGNYLMILNPDIAVFEGAIEKMVNFLKDNPKVGLVGPRLINPDGTRQASCFHFPSLFIPVYRRVPLGKISFIKKSLRHYMMLDANTEKNLPVDWVLGACMMAKKEAVDKVGLMDERFFMYFEDVDWCRRFWQAGFEVYYVYEAEMVHYHQRLSAESPGLKGIFSQATRVHINSWIKYIAKYLGAK
jgi:GT2 family glycosyltransferase